MEEMGVSNPEFQIADEEDGQESYPLKTSNKRDLKVNFQGAFKNILQ
jgi:hypothetical protein